MTGHRTAGRRHLLDYGSLSNGLWTNHVATDERPHCFNGLRRSAARSDGAATWADGAGGGGGGGEIWRLDPFLVVETRGAETRPGRAEARRACAGGDHWALGVSESSGWTAFDGARHERVAPGELAVTRTDDPSLTERPPARSVLLFLPCGRDRKLDAGLLRVKPGKLCSPGAKMLADIVLALPRRLRDARQAEVAPLAEQLSGVISACLVRELAAAARAPAVDGASARERGVRVIRENLGSALLDVNRICRLAGVSRTTLYRVFDGEGGVASVVREMRLRSVMDDFADPDLAHVPIARIAERRGLHNASSFSRSFRRSFGCSPSEARAEAQNGAQNNERFRDARAVL